MKKANIVIAFDEEKLAAVKMYMSQRELDLRTELEKTLDGMYAKFVPSNVREFIDMKAEPRPQSRFGNKCTDETFGVTKTKSGPAACRRPLNRKSEVTDEEE